MSQGSDAATAQRPWSRRARRSPLAASRRRTGLLFKRDFGALWMDRFHGLRIVDYGFFWKRATGLDNLTWWLFEKGV